MTDIKLPTNKSFVNLIGQTFNRLTVIGYSHKRNKSHYWLCQCDCGIKKPIWSAVLRNGKTKSCGCLALETRTKHGHSSTSEYSSWHGMVKRCTKRHCKDYPSYGGSGIEVCDRWLDFSNFLADMGKKPTIKHSIDRIDNSKGYEKSNCRWATRSEQGRNQTTNRIIEYNGEKQPLIYWATLFNLNKNTLLTRLNLGWDIHKALNQVVRSGGGQ